MHGDAHPGNVYFRNGEAGLLVWQAVRRGHPGRELSYTRFTGMTTADHQACQRELLTTYRQALPPPVARS
jgi:aminoglycoside phosphotransferase (APT) family kinase protein